MLLLNADSTVPLYSAVGSYFITYLHWVAQETYVSTHTHRKRLHLEGTSPKQRAGANVGAHQ